ncbi:MAG TPA: hypothetical protein VN650_04580 [Gemmatimonadaceae bacterium]|nr:hypothetical protein [Gemmatimonadaceae bacterium]
MNTFRRRGVNAAKRVRGAAIRLSDSRARAMRRLYSNHASKQTAKVVLFWVPGGMPQMLHLEGAIAAGLRLRGVSVVAVLCDGPFRACVRRELGDGTQVAGWPVLCGGCFAATGRVLHDMDVPYIGMSELVSEELREQLWETTESVTWESIDTVEYDGVSLGKNIRSAITRYLQGHDISGHEEIVREYAYSALVSAAAASEAINRIKPSRIFMSHGTYVDWGPALHVALARATPVAAWMASYLPWRFYFRHVEDGIHIDFHNLTAAAWHERASTPLNESEQNRLDAFLSSRYHKHVSFDMRQFKHFTGDTDELRKRLGLVTDKPVWGIMTHINWDCVSDYSPMTYESFDEWVVATIMEIIDIPDVQWLVKIHPAEAWDNPDSGVQRLIQKEFPMLPSHIRVVTAEDEVSPLDFFNLIDGAVTVYGTSGLEVALQGKPVILAGEAHYGMKGFTHDALTARDYLALLRQASSLEPLTEQQHNLARQYAYCYFVQRQVPVAAVRDPKSTWWSFQYDKRDSLIPGNDAHMDFICDRMLDGEDFVMDDELVALAERVPSTLAETADV